MSPAVCKVNVCCLLARSKLFASAEHQTFTTAEPVLQGGVAENDLHPPAASMVGLASRLGAFAEHSRMVLGVDTASDAMGSAMETLQGNSNAQLDAGAQRFDNPLTAADDDDGSADGDTGADEDDAGEAQDEGEGEAGGEGAGLEDEGAEAVAPADDGGDGDEDEQAVQLDVDPDESVRSGEEPAELTLPIEGAGEGGEGLLLPDGDVDLEAGPAWTEE